jgi:hypothetical protein
MLSFPKERSMIEIRDAEYFSRRETCERSAAILATNDVARRIHLDLAGRYAEKAARSAKHSAWHAE